MIQGIPFLVDFIQTFDPSVGTPVACRKAYIACINACSWAKTCLVEYVAAMAAQLVVALE